MQEKHSGWSGWDWMWLSVTVHATTGLVWGLRDHDGVDSARGDDLETGGPAAVEDGVVVSSSFFVSESQNEIRSESLLERHQSHPTEDIDTVGWEQAADNSTITTTIFSVYGERGPRWFSAIGIIWWSLTIESPLHESLNIWWPNVVALFVLFGFGLVLAVLVIWTRSHAWNRRISKLWVIWFIQWLTMPAMPRFDFC